MFENLSERLERSFRLLKGQGKISEINVAETLKEIRRALLDADVNFKIAKSFTDSVKEKALGLEVLKSVKPGQMMVKIVHDELAELMGGKFTDINLKGNPSVILMSGLQGSGKTTFSGKLANMLKRKKGRHPLLVAGDVYRPAAIEQLKVLAEQIGVPVYTEEGNLDPVKIARNAIKQAKQNGNDVVIIDTAGRLAIDEQMMNEIAAIKKEVQPQEILFVVDAMTGQDAVNVAKAFDDEIGITSVLMSKLDSDTRGGAALSVLAVTGKPIKYVGMGEKLDDFEQFHPKRMASRILGMGDVLTLIEKAENVMSKNEAEKLTKKFKEKSFDMNDLLDQFKQIKKLGSMRSIISMLPGVGDKLKDADIDEHQLDRIEAIITSMTNAERHKPSIINPSRKRRIAAGSGSKVEDVNKLLKQFDQMQQMMKQFTGSKSKMMQRKARKQLAGMNFDKISGKGGGNLPPIV